MTHHHVGEQVSLRGTLYVVRGYSPMGVEPPTILLETAASGELSEVAVAELAPPEPERL